MSNTVFRAREFDWLYGVEMYLDAKGILADTKAVPYVATLLR